MFTAGTDAVANITEEAKHNPNNNVLNVNLSRGVSCWLSQIIKKGQPFRHEFEAGVSRFYVTCDRQSNKLQLCARLMSGPHTGPAELLTVGLDIPDEMYFE